MAENKYSGSQGKVAYHVLLHGLVTGVGFRYSAMREAGKYDDLKGYIRNRTAGTVECLVQGKEEEVRDFLAWLKQGPPSARVDDVELEEVSVKEDLHAFSIAP